MAINCAVCWFEKSGLEPDAEIPNEKFIELFTVCKKHKENLKKEIPMAQCAKCGNQDLEYKKGTSKTTGKQWQGWKCEPCNLMHGMNGVPWGEKPKAPVGKTSFPQSNSVEKKLDTILAILKENFPPVKGDTSEEETPF